MMYSYAPYKYLMIVNRNLTISRFLEKCGVQTGFAQKMFTHLYNSIISECCNVSEDFVQYYQIEYGTLEHFLHCRYVIPKDETAKIVAELSSNPEFILIDYDSLSYGMNDNDSFLFGEKLFDRVIKILKEG